MNPPEASRRASLEDRLFEYVLSRPRAWIYAKDMRPVAGDAWRSRVVKVRERLAQLGYEFRWNGKNAAQSAYMLRPKALGPSADQYRAQPALF